MLNFKSARLNLYSGFVLCGVSIGLMLLATILAPSKRIAAQGPTPTLLPPEPTDIPTLANSSLQDWHNIMTPNGICTFPCWLTITPDVTTLTSAETILENIFQGADATRGTNAQNSDAVFISPITTLLSNNPNIPPSLVAYIEASGSGNVIDRVVAVVPNPQLENDVAWITIWEHFGFDSLVTAYGIPDQIRLIADQSRLDGLKANNLVLYWNDIGFVIEYSRYLEVWDTGIVNPQSPACFNLENLYGFQFVLQNPNNPQSLAELTAIATEYTRPLAEISNFSDEEFIQILSNNNGCLPTDTPFDWEGITCNFSPITVAELITAIQTANGTPEADTICLAQNGMYTFTSAHASLRALPSIMSDIKIVGNGATLTRQAGSPAFRFFDIQATGTLTLENLTLTGADSGSEPGGAILNTGNLTVNNVTFTGNHAGTGAAIDNHRFGGTSNPITATIVNSTFENNTANYGAALDNDANATMTVTTSTFTGNVAVHDGGAIRNHGTLYLTDSQILNNTASAGGSGIFSTGSTTAHNSCISGNTISVTSVVHVGSSVQDFAGNYWGAADGPSGAGGGSGDSVNVNINVADFLTVCPHS